MELDPDPDKDPEHPQNVMDRSMARDKKKSFIQIMDPNRNLDHPQNVLACSVA